MNKEELRKSLDFVNEERERLQDRIEKAVEELELWQPKIETIKLERDYLLDILRGKDD